MTELSYRDRALLREAFPDEAGYQTALKRLADGEPLAYLLGEWYFYDEVYAVSPACLIPRKETEHLVDELIRRLPPNAVFADLGTGSGCIAVSTLAHRPDCRAVALDLSAEALSLARENASRNGVSDRIVFRQADMLAPDALVGARPETGDRFHAVISNPPYIASHVIDTLSPEVRREPRLALDGGPDGLRFYRTLIERLPRHLLSGGFLLFEIGYDQGEALRALGADTVLRDYSGNDRVAIVSTFHPL